MKYAIVPVEFVFPTLHAELPALDADMQAAVDTARENLEDSPPNCKCPYCRVSRALLRAAGEDTP